MRLSGCPAAAARLVEVQVVSQARAGHVADVVEVAEEFLGRNYCHVHRIFDVALDVVGQGRGLDDALKFQFRVDQELGLLRRVLVRLREGKVRLYHRLTGNLGRLLLELLDRLLPRAAQFPPLDHEFGCADRVSEFRLGGGEPLGVPRRTGSGVGAVVERVDDIRSRTRCEVECSCRVVQLLLLVFVGVVGSLERAGLRGPHPRERMAGLGRLVESLVDSGSGVAAFHERVHEVGLRHPCRVHDALPVLVSLDVLRDLVGRPLRRIRSDAPVLVEGQQEPLHACLCVGLRGRVRDEPCDCRSDRDGHPVDAADEAGQHLLERPTASRRRRLRRLRREQRVLEGEEFRYGEHERRRDGGEREDEPPDAGVETADDPEDCLEDDECLLRGGHERLADRGLEVLPFGGDSPGEVGVVVLGAVEVALLVGALVEDLLICRHHFDVLRQRLLESLRQPRVVCRLRQRGGVEEDVRASERLVLSSQCCGQCDDRFLGRHVVER